MKHIPKAWRWPLLVLLYAVLGLVYYRSNGQNLLPDSDTQLILGGLKRHPDFWLWWHHDWPLGNHFYRPMSTFFFQFDHLVYGNNGAGWAWTTALLCIFSTIGVYWAAREITDSPLLTAIATFIFYLWQIDSGSFLLFYTPQTAIVIAVIGFIRHRKNWRAYIPAAFVWMWLAQELSGITSLEFRDLHWIPGRTATSMAVFAMLSIACFARYCRLLPRRVVEKPITSMDVPATKSTVINRETKLPSIAWPIASGILMFLAMACYEQGVMVPAVLGLVALAWYFRGSKIQWSWAGYFAAILLAYIGLHLAFVPHQESRYYKWQKRSNYSAFTFMQRYFFIPYYPWRYLVASFSGGPLMLITSSPYNSFIELVSSIYAMWESRRKWVIIGFGWLGSTLAYAPMAWYKDFDHYHYWPMAVRSIGVAAFLVVAVEMALIAVSPPTLQAPQRLVPAPGSLPHP